MTNPHSTTVDDLFPTWFKKVQVTFSGDLPLTEDERTQVFVIPYTLFEKAIQAYLTRVQVAELELILAKKNREYDGDPMDGGLHCDNCGMMLEVESDLCGCDYVTKERLAELAKLTVL